MKSLTLRSPAKINLFLEVLGKRPDGYHEIETVFQPINIFDHLTIKEKSRQARSPELTITTDQPGLPTGPANLVYQAAALFKKNYRIKQGLDIFIKKRIPTGAGLGGGSSNAATTLMGLNKLWKLGLSQLELSHLGQKLGADVPFFIYRQTALAKRRGELIFPLALTRKFHYLVIWPGFSCPTKKIYGNLNLGLTNKIHDVSIFVNVLRKGRPDQIDSCLFNRLAPTVFRLYPELKNLARYVKSNISPGVSVSGSGSSIFCCLSSGKEVKKTARQLRRSHRSALVFETTNYLP